MPQGILVYGYSLSNARKIHRALETALGQPLDCFGGSGREADIVAAILEGHVPSGPQAGTNPEYTDGPDKVLMLLGFDRATTQVALQNFPTTLARPVFCGLTPTNACWTLGTLVEHLKEERAEIREAQRKQKLAESAE